MPTKTITIEEDVYEMLKSLKQGSRDSFSQVLRREMEPRRPKPNGAEVLRLITRPGGLLGMNEEQLKAIEDLRAEFRRMEGLEPLSK